MTEVRLHGALRDFRRAAGPDPLVCRLEPSVRSVGDAIGALGVPLAEVCRLTCDGAAIGPAAALRADAIYDAYPARAGRLRAPRPAGEARFVLDVHLGTLARRLRLLGFDSWYQPEDPGDEAIARIGADEGRIVLSRDIGLLKRRIVRHGRWLRARQPLRQLTEVVAYYELLDVLRPFTRCLACNGPLEPLDVARARPLVPPAVASRYDAFWRCSDCAHVYWRGSHYTAMRRWLATLGASAEENGNPGKTTAVERRPRCR